MQSEAELIATAAALIGTRRGLSAAERKLIDTAEPCKVASRDLEHYRNGILKGGDPLGEAFSRIRSAEDRRRSGAVYTPESIVRSMMKWLASQAEPCRVVDPGAGSGRFTLAAAEAFPQAEIFAVEMDPLAALMLRANVSARGWGGRVRVLVQDFRELELPRCSGVTAFIGNPPYVRHHDISQAWKAWYATKFASLGIKASALAGLHLHFFLKTRLLAKPGDVGVFITSAEWLDVNYGDALRRLLVEGLGGLAMHVLEPTVEAFPGTATTAAITCFRVGDAPDAMRVRTVAELSKLNGLSKGTEVSRDTLLQAPRWSILVRPSKADAGEGVELGELFRVHRGQVTGANDIWIAGPHAEDLPEQVLIPSVTKARDLIEAGGLLGSAAGLRRVVDIPANLEGFTEAERRRIVKFLEWAKDLGADQSYIAQHRKAWWSVGLKPPAPILCTYMARRPPQFTLNSCSARHINVAHGLYPRGPMDAAVLSRVVAWLNNNTNVSSGRTYAGGLTKFEPREVERLRLPRLEDFQS